MDIATGKLNAPRANLRLQLQRDLLLLIAAVVAHLKLAGTGRDVVQGDALVFAETQDELPVDVEITGVPRCDLRRAHRTPDCDRRTAACTG